MNTNKEYYEDGLLVQEVWSEGVIISKLRELPRTHSDYSIAEPPLQPWEKLMERII